MSGYILLAAISIAVIGVLVWFWGLCGDKPQSLVDDDIRRARERDFIERSLR